MTTTTVTGPVTAAVGPIDLRLHHFRHDHRDGEAHDLPWAIGGVCRVTFRFGPDRLQITKRLTAWHRWLTPGGWPQHERPSEPAIAEGYEAVERMLRDQLDRHGVDPASATVHRTEG